MLTVMLATRNRATLLPRVLGAFAAIAPPRGGWRLVVVDNASTDATRTVLAGFAERLPLLVLPCEAPGMNAALNVACTAIAGDLVVKTDDDVLPDPGWLAAYRDAADAHPEAGLFGGTVRPVWDATLPAWLADGVATSHSVLYAACDRAAGPCPLHAIYGPNWAVRAAHLAGPAPFNPAFGPDHTNAQYAMGGETAFFMGLAEAGIGGHFVPEAVLGHIVRAEQMTEDWVLARAYRYGRGSGAWMPPDFARGRPLAAGLPAELLVRLAAYGAAARAVRLLPPSRRRIAIRYHARYLSGVAAALRRA